MTEEIKQRLKKKKNDNYMLSARKPFEIEKNIYYK